MCCQLLKQWLMSVIVNETEFSMFNREAYEAFKLNPEVCLFLLLKASFSARGERREARERLIRAGQMDMMRLSHANTKSSATNHYMYDVVDDSRSSIYPAYSTITIVMFSLALEFNEFTLFSSLEWIL